MYPVVYSAQHEAEGRSRLTVFFRLLLALPWAIVAGLWTYLILVTVLISWVALLLTGRYPAGLYGFHSSYLRFQGRVTGFARLLTDEFPPFSGQDEPTYPIRVGVAPPKEQYSRAKVLFRIILLIPVAFLGYVMGILLNLIGIAAWVVLVLTAKLPEGLYKPMRAANSYLLRATSYFLLLTEEFPPFWLDEADEAPGLGGGAGPPSLEPTPPPVAV